MNTLQLGIDIGRVIAPTAHAQTPDDLRIAAQRILDMLGVDLEVNEDTSFQLGLGYGLRDRREVPIESGALGLESMGLILLEEVREQAQKSEAVGSEGIDRGEGAGNINVLSL